MTTRVVSQIVLVCDGCAAEFGRYPSRTEARAAAYVQGWRFPAKPGRTGKASKLHSNDVCPECTPSWPVTP